jgi:hypothetical protein
MARNRRRTTAEEWDRWERQRLELADLMEKRRQRFAAADAREAERQARLRRLSFGLLGRS